MQSENASASHVTHLAIADRTLTSLSNATEDPGAFTDNVTPNGTARMTLAVPGAAAQTSTPGAAATSSGAVNPALTIGGVSSTPGAAASASTGTNPTLTLGAVERIPSPALERHRCRRPGGPGENSSACRLIDNRDYSTNDDRRRRAHSSPGLDCLLGGAAHWHPWRSGTHPRCGWDHEQRGRPGLDVEPDFDTKPGHREREWRESDPWARGCWSNLWHCHCRIRRHQSDRRSWRRLVHSDFRCCSRPRRGSDARARCCLQDSHDSDSDGDCRQSGSNARSAARSVPCSRFERRRHTCRVRRGSQSESRSSNSSRCCINSDCPARQHRAGSSAGSCYIGCVECGSRKPGRRAPDIDASTGRCEPDAGKSRRCQFGPDVHCRTRYPNH
jgi:hypothetical protein